MRRAPGAVGLIALLLASTAGAFEPGYEAANYAKINERAAVDYTPEFNALLAAEGAERG